MTKKSAPKASTRRAAKPQTMAGRLAAAMRKVAEEGGPAAAASNDGGPSDGIPSALAVPISDELRSRIQRAAAAHGVEPGALLAPLTKKLERQGWDLITKAQHEGPSALEERFYPWGSDEARAGFLEHIEAGAWRWGLAASQHAVGSPRYLEASLAARALRFVHDRVKAGNAEALRFVVDKSDALFERPHAVEASLREIDWYEEAARKPFPGSSLDAMSKPERLEWFAHALVGHFARDKSILWQKVRELSPLLRDAHELDAAKTEVAREFRLDPPSSAEAALLTMLRALKVPKAERDSIRKQREQAEIRSKGRT